MPKAVSGEAKIKNTMDESTVKIVVTSQENAKVTFEIKRSTKFKKLMTAYCHKIDENHDHIVFLYDGKRLNHKQTPKSVGMMKKAEVTAFMHQTGGGSRSG